MACRQVNNKLEKILICIMVTVFLTNKRHREMSTAHPYLLNFSHLNSGYFFNFNIKAFNCFSYIVPLKSILNRNLIYHVKISVFFVNHLKTDQPSIMNS
jgi:hypothetical protein